MSFTPGLMSSSARGTVSFVGATVVVDVVDVVVVGATAVVDVVGASVAVVEAGVAAAVPEDPSLTDRSPSPSIASVLAASVGGGASEAPSVSSEAGEAMTVVGAAAFVVGATGAVVVAAPNPAGTTISVA